MEYGCKFHGALVLADELLRKRPEVAMRLAVAGGILALWTGNDRDGEYHVEAIKARAPAATETPDADWRKELGAILQRALEG